MGKFRGRVEGEGAMCGGVGVLGWSVVPGWEETFSRAAAPRQALEACDGWLESGGSAKAVVEAVLGAQRVRECARFREGLPERLAVGRHQNHQREGVPNGNQRKYKH